MEEQLGVKLFQRTTRRLRLTEDGKLLLIRARPALDELRTALVETTAGSQELRGPVSFSVSQAFGRRFILPVLPKFQERHPGVRLEVTATDSLDDLVVEGLDFSVRLGELPDSSMISRKLGELEVILAVPASLVRSKSVPSTINDLACLSAIGFRVPGTRNLYHWTFEAGGKTHSFKPEDPVMITDSIEIVADLVAKGVGAAPVPRYLVEEQLKAGTIVLGLRDFHMPTVPVHLCFSGRYHRPSRVQVLVDHLVQSVRIAAG